jgi:hypothetical protein
MTFPDPKVRCPATGFAKSCRSIVSKYDCPKYVHIAGVDPSNGNPIDKYGCVDSFLPLLLIENAQQSRQTGAAVESFRNEVAKRQDENFINSNWPPMPLLGRNGQ